MRIPQRIRTNRRRAAVREVMSVFLRSVGRKSQLQPFRNPLAVEARHEHEANSKAAKTAVAVF